MNQILIVDDSPTIRRMVKASLSSLAGHRVLLEVPHVAIHPIGRLNDGFYAHVPKPFVPENLISTIARAVELTA